MPDDTTVITARSILVRVTIDEDRELLITTANGVPRRLKPDRAHEQLCRLALDTSIPEAKMEAEGFSIKEAFQGLGRILAEANREPEGR